MAYKHVFYIAVERLTICAADHGPLMRLDETHGIALTLGGLVDDSGMDPIEQLFILSDVGRDLHACDFLAHVDVEKVDLMRTVVGQYL